MESRKFNAKLIDEIIDRSKKVRYDFGWFPFRKPHPLLRGFSNNYKKYFEQSPHYYRLLTAAAQFFDSFLDIGARGGYSAIAFLYGNNDSKILSIDIKDQVVPSIKESVKNNKNFSFKLADARKCAFGQHYDVIFLDISHNGKDETAVIKNLEKHGLLRSCVMLFDDIHLNKEMEDFWNSLSLPNKRDITWHGQKSGTGICVFP